jgi:hypothetical protein
MYSIGVTVFETTERILTANELFDRLRKRDIKTNYPLMVR